MKHLILTGLLAVSGQALAAGLEMECVAGVAIASSQQHVIQLLSPKTGLPMTCQEAGDNSKIDSLISGKEIERLKAEIRVQQLQFSAIMEKVKLEIDEARLERLEIEQKAKQVIEPKKAITQKSIAGEGPMVTELYDTYVQPKAAK